MATGSATANGDGLQFSHSFGADGIAGAVSAAWPLTPQ